jgi:cytochrome P450
MQNLIMTVMDVFLAGTDTVSSYLEWFTLYMLLYPEVQTKCQKEIDSVIGNRPVDHDDRANTHYMEATILEITYEKSKFSFFSHRDS